METGEQASRNDRARSPRPISAQKYTTCTSQEHSAWTLMPDLPFVLHAQYLMLERNENTLSHILPHE